MDKRLFAIGVVAAGVAYMAFVALRPARAAVDCSDKVAPFIEAKLAVRDRLKSPSEARFADMSDRGVSVRAAGKCTYSVSGYVDAVNGFGVRQRMHYTGLVEGNTLVDRWMVRELNLAP